MLLTDQDLLNFDHATIQHFDLGEAQDILEDEHADIYRAQLVTAHWLDGWAERLSEGDSLDDPKFDEGFTKALREVAAHLRQGDLIPGGVIFEDVATGRDERFSPVRASSDTRQPRRASAEPSPGDTSQ